MSWRSEPIRHSLSSHGVGTALGKSKYREMKEKLSKNPDVQKDINIKPPEELKNIDWNEAIFSDEYEPKETKKLIKLFWWCNHHNTWQYFDFERFFNNVKPKLHDSLEVIKLEHSKHYSDEELEEITDEYRSILYKLDNIPGSLKVKINLVDRIIHLEHVHRTIWNIENMNELREDFEEEYI